MSDKNAVITCIVIHIHTRTQTHICARVYVVKRRKTKTMTHDLLLYARRR